MSLKKQKNIEKYLITAIITMLLIFITFGSVVALAAWKDNSQSGRDVLWTKGGISSVSNAEILTVNALLRYASDGVFGDECRHTVKLYGSDFTTISSFTNKHGGVCKKADQFYVAAQTYAGFADARMKLADPTGERLDKAMTRFSDLATEVFAFLIGFGCLTAILVFVIIFMKLSWMPSHSYQKRQVLMEIATSGASIMLLGNLWVVMSLFQSIFSRFWQTFAVYSKDWRTVANMLLSEYQGFITGLSGIATLLVLAMFIINFVGLAMEGDNANKRSEKIQSLLHCAIAAAGLGSVTLIVGFFWSLF